MKYAIVESGGKQYRAVEGDFIEVDRLPVETGKDIKLEKVLLLADGENFTVGTPVIKETPVWAKVVEHFRGDKVTIFNYAPKKRIRIKTGHRQSYTRLLVEQIGGATLVKKEVKAEAKQEKAEVEKPVKAEAEEKKPAKKETKAEAKKTTKAEPKKATKATTEKKAPAKKTTTRKPAAK